MTWSPSLLREVAFAGLFTFTAAACTNHFATLFDGGTDIGTDIGTDGATDGAIDGAAPCASRSGLLALLVASRGAQHHVDPSGSDSGPGTADRPWKTAQKAVDSLAPGETAFVHAGVYPDAVTWTKAGTASAPITLAGDPRAPAIFTGTFELRGAFTRVTGLVFDGALRTGTVYPLLAARSSDLEISGNELRGAKRVAIEGFAEGAVSPDRLRIVANWFHDGAQGIALHGGTGALIASNLLQDHSDVGILLDPSPQQTSILANTIARGRVGVMVGANSSATAAGARIVNNVISTHRAQAIASAGTGTGSIARRNLLFANASAVTGTVADTDNVIGDDPRFVATDDFHLQPDSPALGAADLAFTPESDRDGRCRPVGAPDLGAFEQ
jgi:hypothetical protein